MKRKTDPFTKAIAPSTTDDEINEEVRRFLENGGTISRMTIFRKNTKKGIREKPSKGAIFLSTREERYLDE